MIVIYDFQFGPSPDGSPNHRFLASIAPFAFSYRVGFDRRRMPHSQFYTARSSYFFDASNQSMTSMRSGRPLMMRLLVHDQIKIWPRTVITEFVYQFVQPRFEINPDYTGRIPGAFLEFLNTTGPATVRPAGEFFAEIEGQDVHYRVVFQFDLCYNSRMLRVMTVRLYPSKSQERALIRYLDASRRVYNHALEWRIKAWKRRGESITYNQQTAHLTRWRANSEFIRMVPFTVCREALKRLDKAYKAFLRRCKYGDAKKGHPRFKSWRRWDSFEILQTGNYVKDGKITVPKLGPIRCRNLRPIVGIIKCLRVVRRGTRWLAQLTIDDGRTPPPLKPVKRTVGLDVGLKNFVVDSTGISIPAPRFFRELEQKLKSRSRAVSRKRKGGRNRYKAVIRLRRVHQRIADSRSDFTHKLSKLYAGSYDAICVEKLTIKNMVRGRLAKSILDAAWGQFLQRLNYKAEGAGVHFVEVDPRGTSQECSQCHETVKKDLSVRVHDCPHCGLVLDRDLNAARNILARGLETLSVAAGRADTKNACGEMVIGPLIEAGSLDF